MAKDILWVDNDSGYIAPYVKTLRQWGYSVTTAESLTEGAQALDARHFDLLILDIMMPTAGAEEEEQYPPEETDTGHESGLLFYRRLRAKLEQAQTKVLVLTIRPETRLVEIFEQEGLPREQYRTKVALREADNLVQKVNDLLGTSP